MTPKSTCSKQAKSFNSIIQKVKNITCNRFARQSGFKLRIAKKVTGKSMILGFFMLALQNKNTLQGCAEQICRVSRKMVSKQAIWSRISDGLIRFLMLALKFETSHQVSINAKQVKMHPVLKRFKRILLQDSTTLAQQANCRRRKAREDRDYRLQHSKEYYELLG